MTSTTYNQQGGAYPQQTHPIDQSVILNQPGGTTSTSSDDSSIFQKTKPVLHQPLLQGFPSPYIPHNPSGSPGPPDASIRNTGIQVENVPPPPPGFVEKKAVQNQDKWMSKPLGIQKCPAGLEYLTALDLLVVKQKIELFEVKSGVETNNKYMVKNNKGQRVYYIEEDNDWFTLNCCGGRTRPFDMKVFDVDKNEVIHLYRPLACIGFCFPCCLQSIEVSSPPGNRLGTIKQEWTLCNPVFSVKNNLGEVVLRIEGPFSTCSFYVRAVFKVLTPSGQEIGQITKEFAGFAREIYTDADVFSVTFPLDLEVRVKALLLGACLLIDAIYFEA